MEPLDGDTIKIAQYMINEYGEMDNTSDSNVVLDGFYEKKDYEEDSTIELDIPSELKIQAFSVNEIDESQKNTGKTISIDLMKMIHHSIDYNNTTYFLTSLNPKNSSYNGI